MAAGRITAYGSRAGAAKLRNDLCAYEGTWLQGRINNLLPLPERKKQFRKKRYGSSTRTFSVTNRVSESLAEARSCGAGPQ
jgi:hypothetical protein